MLTINPIRMVSVSSSNIRAIGYDAESRTMHVEFRGGGKYEHTDVPAWHHSSFMSATSKGGYYHRYFHNRYGCRRIR